MTEKKAKDDHPVPSVDTRRLQRALERAGASQEEVKAALRALGRE